MESVIVVGGGVFGATAALELRRRGLKVDLFESGTIPNPLAASTDVSKVVRMEYGADEVYMELGERARKGWLNWNDRLEKAGGASVYHETGVAMFCMEVMQPGGFEYESYQALQRRGHVPEGVAGTDLLSRFPAWNQEVFVDGFYHASGGYVESGAVQQHLYEWLIDAGVHVHEQAEVGRLVVESGRAKGVQSAPGSAHYADHVVVAAGAWTATLLPELKRHIRSTGHPVFHIQPSNPELFRAHCFPTFTSDVSRTGYYGFPLNRDGVVKIGVHAIGREVEPNGTRVVTTDQINQLRSFLERAFPRLSNDPVVYTRLCLYADTPDEHFWIARHDDIENLTISSGGSGHAFKFAPVLGTITADTVLLGYNECGDRFSWRSLSESAGQEAARCHAVH